MLNGSAYRRNFNGFTLDFFSLLQVPNTSRQHRQNRGRMNGHMHPQGGGHSVSYMPHLQQPTQSVLPLKDSSNQQVSVLFLCLIVLSHLHIIC